MRIHTYDIGVAGGGASGCMAAVIAAQKGLSVAVLEKNDSLLKKVIASGNGRCNISNTNCDTSGEVAAVLAELGIYLSEEEEGRLYPRTRYSRTVSERFEKLIRERKIDVFTGCEIENIEKKDDFEVTSGSDRFIFRKLLLATGGKAGPQFGTAGDSYRFLRKLGHTVSVLRPSLTGVECDGDFSRLKGIRAYGRAELLKNGKAVCPPEPGEIQFTAYGLSGICIMNLSRYILLDRDVSMEEAYRRYEIRLDLAPELDAEEVQKMLDNSSARAFVRNELAEHIGDSAERLKKLTFTVTGCRGWKDAQVTAGGAALDEFDLNTMESELVPGLYVSGEALDYDGPCGGYNLNHAWITGIRAGRAMAECIG